MNEQPAISIKDMTFSYAGAGTPTLEDINFNVRQNSFVCMVGPNGGGKTTLLKLMLGLLKPDKGTIQINGKAPGAACKKIGYVPQYVNFDLHFPVRAIDVVLMGTLGKCSSFGRYPSHEKKAAERALAEVDMDNLRNSPLGKLSGGQRQRILIARALATEPDLLLLDEPLANVDITVQSDFNALLQDLSKKMTIIIVTHDTSFVSKAVESVVCVNHTVAVHPVSEITGETIFQIYGSDVHMVRHDHKCAEGEHQHG